MEEKNDLDAAIYFSEKFTVSPNEIRASNGLQIKAFKLEMSPLVLAKYLSKAKIW